MSVPSRRFVLAAALACLAGRAAAQPYPPPIAGRAIRRSRRCG